MRPYRKCAVSLLTAVALLAGFASAQAKMVLKQDFAHNEVKALAVGEAVVDPRGKPAWRNASGGHDKTARRFIEKDVAGLKLDPAQGSIDLLLTRDEADPIETLFTLTDAEYQRLFVARLFWNGGASPLKGIPAIMFYRSSANYYWQDTQETQYGGTQPVDAVSLKTPVPVNTQVRLTFTWGGPDGNIIYLNGAVLSANKNPAFALPAKIAAATRLLLGGETEKGFAGTYDMTHSPLSRFEVYDRALTPAEIDAIVPESVARILAEPGYANEVKVSWTASSSYGVNTYEIYKGAGSAANIAAEPVQTTGKLEFSDSEVIPGIEYFYRVVAVDYAGRKSLPSDVVSAKPVAGDGPAISLITTDPLGKPMRPGQTIIFSVKGQTRGKAEIELAGLGKTVQLAEQGRTGVYKGAYTIAATDSGETTGAYQLVAKLTDDLGSNKIAGPRMIVLGKDLLNDITPPVVDSADHDSFRVSGFSGKLVAGNLLTVTLKGEKAGFASFKLAGITDQIAMVEGEPGVYKGSYTIGWNDEGAKIPVEVSHSDLAGNEVKVVAGSALEIDTRVRMSVMAKDVLLPADSKSKTRILVKTTNANGEDVTGHELMLKLHTTDEYTGVVGGGKVENRFAAKDDEDDIEVKWGGVTDNFGEVAATYTAGHAAKTALVVVKDLTSGSIGTGWVNTYVASTVAIQLVPPSAREVAAQPSIRMTATPSWLTADGRSKSRIRAYLVDPNGAPIKGARFKLEVSSDNGSIKLLRGVTDDKGMVEADYRAGTLAGIVTIIATAPDQKVTSNIQIELRSDAPAKIAMVSSAVSLPADGRSTSDIRALVTDINDNPNKKAPVVFSLSEGTGLVRALKDATDDRGVISAVYTAGRAPGTAVVEARHTSRAPTSEELSRIYGTIFIPRVKKDLGLDKIRVDEWYFDAGEEVKKGDAIVKISVRDESWVLTAPENGKLVNQNRFKRDYVEIGDTIGYIQIDPEIWKNNYVK